MNWIDLLIMVCSLFGLLLLLPTLQNLLPGGLLKKIIHENLKINQFFMPFPSLNLVGLNVSFLKFFEFLTPNSSYMEYARK